ncbi:Serine/threonine protein kinase PRP4 [Mycena chlorophos]|uniref:non-specific serine/threonine protein kinase n=1 Tax=Mycena chlorophos TaxID=658473 RepID=A0A8H6WN23_MYCCL|nr:Serine/threonine protein kinase PRP4 [Mycena chlorophos]
MQVDAPEIELIPSPPPLEQLLADRRARRAAILARHASGTPNPSLPGSTGPFSGNPSVSLSEDASKAHVAILAAQASATPNASLPGSTGPFNGKSTNGYSDKSAQNGHDVSTPDKSRSPSPAPEQQDDMFTLAKPDSPGRVTASNTSNAAQAGQDPQVNAADYDPSLDRREDEDRRVKGIPVDEDEEEEVEVDDEDEDDVDDMFSLGGPSKPKKKKLVKKKRPVEVAAPVLHSDTASDPEGYYNVILGEVLVAPDGERYQVYASVGRGMFAVVVRARVLSDGEDSTKDGAREVAIKIVRSQEVMQRAGMKEAAILNKLQAADPDDKKHLVRLERTFEHRGHLCLVFESLSMNLRDVVKRFGKDVGLNIRAVRAYAHQLFISLGHLRKLGVIHADIKPDNILVNEAKTVLKLCDLGSASDAAENEITPYLVSRFYRAPEIILGVPYDASLDIWSVGCTLYELYTGKILFPGRSNNQMLLHMMELKGRFNSKMIKRAKFGDVYFDEMGGFESVEREKASGNDVIRKVHIQKPTRDLRARLLGGARMSDEEMNVLLHFIDLLDRCLALDPARRITPKEALGHPFIRGATK